MLVTVHTPPELIRFTDGRCETVVDAATVCGAMDAVFGQYPHLKSRVVDDQQELYSHLKLLYNQQVLDWADAADQPLAEGDKIELFAIVSGG